MLSRFAIRSAQEIKPCWSVAVRPCNTVAQSTEKKDEVVLERQKRPIYPGKVRMGFVPEEFFQLLYKKTGVTGPYVFGFSLFTYCASKELIMLDHETANGLAMLIVLVYAIKNFGPSVAAFLDDEIEKEKNLLDSYRDDTIQKYKDSILDEETSQEEAKNQTVLFEAKRENVGLQLEGAYRKRLRDIHHQVKRRLDYQLETSNVLKKFEQRHMVDWIISNVRKSITPAQEVASLKQCLSDLKTLTSRA